MLMVIKKLKCQALFTSVVGIEDDVALPREAVVEEPVRLVRGHRAAHLLQVPRAVDEHDCRQRRIRRVSPVISVIGAASV